MLETVRIPFCLQLNLIPQYTAVPISRSSVVLQKVYVSTDISEHSYDQESCSKDGVQLPLHANQTLLN